MRIGFKFFKPKTIEKAAKGGERSNHKYIRRFTGNNGNFVYIYPEDMVNPFKLLLSVFAITKERIANVFQKEKIEENYGVDQNTFAAHVLEYLSDRAKWDKFFSNPTIAHRNKKPENLNENKKEKDVKPAEDKKKTEKKDTKKRPSINRSLMRKIWGIFNPAKEKDSESMFESESEVSVIPAEEKIKDFVGRKTSVDSKTKITTMKWPDGREIKTDAKGNVIYDNTNIEPVENETKVVEPDRDYQSEAASLTNEQLRIAMESMVNEVKRLNAANDTEGLEQANLWIQALNDEYYKRSDARLKNQAEEHKNRSEAMLGNDNAKKDVHEMEEKAEFDGLISRYNELDKEYKSLGGSSNRYISSEEHERKRVVNKEKNEVERKLRELVKKVDESSTEFRFHEMYKDPMNEYLKRRVKRQTVSWDWINKKFGPAVYSNIPFAPGLSYHINEEEDINKPDLYFTFTPEGWTSQTSVVIEIDKLLNNEWYIPSYVGNYSNNDIEYIQDKGRELKEKLSNVTGETPAEKFFNMVLGENNEFTKKSDVANVPNYRFTKDGIKDKNGVLHKIRASVRNEGEPDEYMYLDADDYGASIPSIFYPKNETDSQTDYFDKDHAVIQPDHPYYNHAKIMALKNQLYRGRATKWAAMSKEEQAKIEKQIKDLEKTLKEPTEEELKAYRERRDHIEEVKETWEEAERNVLRKEREEKERQKENENMNKLADLLGKLADALEKEPPVNLEGMTKEEKIETLEDRIFKLGVEIKNSKDPEVIESKTQFRDKLSRTLEEVRNEPETVIEETVEEVPETPVRPSAEIETEIADLRRKLFTAEDEEFETLNNRISELNEELYAAKESEAQEHANRSAAMIGNQNAYKGLSGVELEDKVKELGREIGRMSAENEKIYDDNSGFMRGADDDPNSDYQKWVKNADSIRKFKEEVGKITDERISRGVTEEERRNILSQHKTAYDGDFYSKTPSEVVEEKKQNLEDLWNKRGQGNGFELDKEIEDARNDLARAEMDEKDSEDDITTPIPEINKDVARRVSDNSMSGHGGEVYQHDVNVEMQNFREMFDTSKMNEQQKEYFQERLNSYAGLVGDSYNEMASKRLAAGPSWAVAGPAKFNNARFAKRMDAERRAYENFEEKKDKFIKNTEKRLKELKYTGGAENEEEVKTRVFNDYANGNYSYNDKIDNTDPYAIEKISGKIKFLENAHDVTLMYRKASKKAGLSTMTWNDRPEDTEKRKEVMRDVIKAAKDKGYTDGQIKDGLNHPFPQNQTQEIARNKQRLEELKARKAAIEVMNTVNEENGSGGNNAGRVDFDGGYVQENLEMDRIQIIYDGKPDKETISTLKHNGFHWTPSQGAWQRQLNRNGRMAVNRVFAETGIDKKIDIDGAGEVKKSDQKEDEMFIKAFEYCDLYLNKSYNVGDLRTWKGKIFIMNKNGKWERYI